MLSNREKKLAVAVGVIGVLVGGLYAGKEYRSSRAALSQEIGQTEERVAKMEKVANNRADTAKKWKELLDAGLKFDQSLAQTQAVQAIEKFASDRRVTVEFSNIVSLPQIGEFAPVDMTVKAHGSELHVSELLYLMETAKFPLKITSVQITPVKEGLSDLVATINVTTSAYKEGAGKKGAK